MRGITMDGIFYDVNISPQSFEREFTLLEGNNSGISLTGRSIRDILGTKYNFTMQVEPNPYALNDYDAFFEAISAPVETHIFSVPYGQGEMEFEAAVESGTDRLLKRADGRTYWGNLDVHLIAVEPQRY